MAEDASDFDTIDEFLRDVRRTRFAHGLYCVHCRSAHVRRHGFFRRRQRYRCLACRRTFSDLTGTAQAYTKRPLDWQEYKRCMDDGLTIRQAAARVEISVATSFRWRHALLKGLVRKDNTGLRGDVELTDLWFAMSEKGRRDLERPARRRGVKNRLRYEGEVVRVIVACDRCDGCVTSLARTRRVAYRHLVEALASRMTSARVLFARQGRLGPSAKFARHHLGIAFEPVSVPGARGGALVHLRTVTAYAERFLGWLRRFNGVATKYMPNYLVWHRRIDGPGSFRFESASGL
jgi:transposase-like protein